MGGSIRALRIITACALLFACGKKEGRFSSSESMEEFTARRTRRGKLLWEISGSKMIREDQISVTGASGFFYGEDGKMFLKADRASFSEDGAGLELEGNVYFRDSAAKSELYMDNLKWDEWQQLYVTDNRVRQVSEEAVILGTGLRADKELNRVEILNPEVVSSASSK